MYPDGIYLFKLNDGNTRSCMNSIKIKKKGHVAFLPLFLSGTDFTHCSDVSVVDFEQENGG